MRRHLLGPLPVEHGARARDRPHGEQQLEDPDHVVEPAAGAPTRRTVTTRAATATRAAYPDGDQRELAERGVEGSCMAPSSRPAPRARRPHEPSRPAADVVARLRAAGCVFAEDEAALLVEAAGSPAELDADGRATGWPACRWSCWWGGRSSAACGSWSQPGGVRAAPAHRAAGRARPPPRPPPGAVVVDLCCGTGAVGAALAAAAGRRGVRRRHRPGRGPPAPAATSPPDRVLEGDLYDALPATLRGRVDVLA